MFITWELKVNLPLMNKKSKISGYIRQHHYAISNLGLD